MNTFYAKILKLNTVLMLKLELEKMLVREERMEIYKKCLDFLDTRIELDQKGFKFSIFEH